MLPVLAIHAIATVLAHAAHRETSPKRRASTQTQTQTQTPTQTPTPTPTPTLKPKVTR